MKPKGVPTFTSKLSQHLSKFRDSSTISIAHDQIRKLLGEYSFSQIANQFASKMDSCDRLSEREKRQYAKIYITIMDAYGADVLYQQYYERLMESLVRKTVGVGDVIGHLCKNLLSRIHPPENATEYIAHLLNLFRTHPDICKIIRYIAQYMDMNICLKFQSQMVTILCDKTTLKSKLQAMQSLLSLILSFQQRFQYLPMIIGIISKNYKNQDYNVRKTCVDICYAMMVVKEEMTPAMHRVVQELKYDKIKHVREAVANYNVLYKQIYGEEEEEPQKSHQRINANSNTHRNDDNNHNSSYRDKAQKGDKVDRTREIASTLHKKQKRNQDFFQNAKQSNVIKIPDQNKSAILTRGHQQQEDQEELGQYQHSVQKSNSQEAEESAPRSSDQRSYKEDQQGRNLESRDHYPKITQTTSNANFKDYLKSRPISYLSPRSQRTKTAPSFEKGQILQENVRKNAIEQLDREQSNSHTMHRKNETQTMKGPESIAKGKNSIHMPQQEEKMQQPMQKIKVTQKKKRDTQSSSLHGRKQRQTTALETFPKNKQEKHSKPMRTIHQQIQQLNLAQIILSFKKTVMNKLDFIENKVILIQNRVASIEVQLLNQNQTPHQNHRAENQEALQYTNGKKISNNNQAKQKAIQGMRSIVESQIQQQPDEDQVFPVEETHPFESSHQNQYRQSGTIVQKLDGIPADSYQSSLGNNHILSNRQSKIQSQQGKQSSVGFEYQQNDKGQFEGNIILTGDDAIESNLAEKVNQSIRDKNWDEAYSLVLANSQQNLLVKILELSAIPKDKVVEQCLLMQVRKVVNNYPVLKWLKCYMDQREISKKNLKKFKNDIEKVDLKEVQKRDKDNFRSYVILKRMILEEIEDALQQNL